MKKILSILLATVMLFSAVSCLSVGALSGSTADETTDVDDDVVSGEYKLGEVVVGLKPDSPSVEILLADFEITEIRHIGLSIYHVKFVEKTEEIVWKAIAVLEECPYVKFAEPNWTAYLDDGIISTPEDPTKPGEDDVISSEFEAGSVLVCLKNDSPSVGELLPGFEIVESRVIIEFSDQTTCYYVKFADETEEIVWKAIAVLSESPYVKYAEPNYYAYVDPPVETSTSETPTQPTTEITATSSENLKSSTSDTAETKAAATSDTVKTVNSNGTVQTGQNNFIFVLTLLFIISAAAMALFMRLRYRD